MYIIHSHMIFPFLFILFLLFFVKLYLQNTKAFTVDYLFIYAECVLMIIILYFEWLNLYIFLNWGSGDGMRK